MHYTSTDIPTQTIDGQEYMIMYEGETGHIIVLVADENKTLSGEYTSGNTEILTVENTEENPGLITAIKKGDTTITLHHEEALEGDVVVNVKVKEKPTLITTNLTIIQGYTGQIIIKNLSGEDITNKFTFTPENSNIATVDSNGLVTLKQEQNTNITATYNDGMRVTTYQIPIIAQKTLTTSAGITATAFSAQQTQDIIKILMDTGMISNENDVDNIVRIDTTNGLTQITITIDREDGTQVAVVAYENGEVKYIQTGEVQNKQVTVDVGNSHQNIVATTDSNGNVTSTVITPGFYDNNNNLIASWDYVVNTLNWDYSRNYTWQSYSQQTNNYAYDYYSRHLYCILKTTNGSKLINATKLVIPDGITSLGTWTFINCKINLDTIVFPNSFTRSDIGNIVSAINSKLKNYTIRSDNPNFDSINGIIYNESHTELLVSPTNKTNIIIPEGVKTIKDKAFEQNISKSVGPYDSDADIKIPNSVTTLGWASLYNMPNLEWAELWDGLITIETQEFNNSVNLKSLYIPSSVTNMPTFYDSYYGGYSSILYAASNNLAIYCQSTSQPSGWSTYWNARSWNGSNRAPVTWGVSRETYRNNNRYLN